MSAKANLFIILLCAFAAFARADEVTLVYTTNVIGELEPCGCSVRLGGLPRRVDLIDELRAKDPNLLLLDTGDHFFRDTAIESFELAQHERKASILADAMKALRYDLVCPGDADLARGLDEYRKLARQAGVAPICANLFAGNELAFPATAKKEVGGIRIGFIGLLLPGQPLKQQQPHPLAVEDPVKVATAQVAALRGSVDLLVVLSHLGYVADRELAAKVPGIDVIIGGHSRDPIGTGVEVGKTLIVQSGYQGKWLGSMRLRVAGGKVEKLSAIQHEVHPARTADPKWAKVVDDYKKWVSEVNTRPTTGTPAVQQDEVYWGAELCSQCHQRQADFWKKTPHAHAYETLVSKNKQHDTECLACHTVAFAKTRSKPGLASISDVRGTENVQCESCHAAGSRHKEPEMRRRATLETTCRGCHDPKNSPKFEFASWLPRMRCPK